MMTEKKYIAKAIIYAWEHNWVLVVTTLLELMALLLSILLMPAGGIVTWLAFALFVYSTAHMAVYQWIFELPAEEIDKLRELI